MKNIFIIAVAFLVFSCKKEAEESFGKEEDTKPTTETATLKSPADLGKEIFEGKGTCATCHKPDVKLIGPSLQDIAKIYKEQNGNIVDFLKNDAKPIVDPTQYEIMKANFLITKAMSDDELKALEEYVYTFSK
jgi:cytochrome c